MATPTIKQPTENKTFNMPFSNIMPSGETIASITSTAFTNLGLVSGSTDITIVSSAINADNVSVDIKISAGQNLEQYKITIVVTDSNGDTHEADAILQLKEY